MYRTGDLTNDPWISRLVPLVLYINITWTSSRTSVFLSILCANESQQTSMMINQEQQDVSVTAV